PSIPKFQIYYRALVNPAAYSLEKYGELECDSFFLDQGSTPELNQRAIELIKSNKVKYFSCFQDTKYITVLNKELVYWFFENIASALPIHIDNTDQYGVELKVKSSGGQFVLFRISNWLYIELLYTLGRYDRIFQIINFEYGYIKSYPTSLEFLDQFLNHTLKNGLSEDNKEIISYFLQKCLGMGDLRVANLIALKYSQLFNKKSITNKISILDTFKYILHTSINMDYIEVTQLLLKYISISKKDYNEYKQDHFSIVDEKLKNYFK
ncbi:hypothetical protein DICPUDRAFT_153211, partial [Dictyostelium purpureum]